MDDKTREEILSILAKAPKEVLKERTPEEYLEYLQKEFLPGYTFKVVNGEIQAGR
jgi:hypothetical protein